MNFNETKTGLKIYEGLTAEEYAALTKEPHSFYIVEGVGIYKGETLIAGAKPLIIGEEQWWSDYINEDYTYHLTYEQCEKLVNGELILFFKHFDETLRLLPVNIIEKSNYNAEMEYGVFKFILSRTIDDYDNYRGSIFYDLNGGDIFFEQHHTYEALSLGVYEGGGAKITDQQRCTIRNSELLDDNEYMPIGTWFYGEKLGRCNFDISDFKWKCNYNAKLLNRINRTPLKHNSVSITCSLIMLEIEHYGRKMFTINFVDDEGYIIIPVSSFLIAKVNGNDCYLKCIAADVTSNRIFAMTFIAYYIDNNNNIVEIELNDQSKLNFSYYDIYVLNESLSQYYEE